MISVQREDFNVAELYQSLNRDTTTGAVAMFVGLVRDFSESPEEELSFELEHYPGMTEHNLMQIVRQAETRWPIQKSVVVHRVGPLSVSDQIVFVGVSSSHRAAAFEACEFIMDYLKSRAAFWKKETRNGVGSWVEAKDTDTQRLERWLEGESGS